MCKWWILCGLFTSLLDCRLSSNVILAANRREIIWFACKRLSLSALPKDWAWSSLSNSTLGGSVCYLPVGTALLCGTNFYSLYCDVWHCGPFRWSINMPFLAYKTYSIYYCNPHWMLTIWKMPPIVNANDMERSISTDTYIQLILITNSPQPYIISLHLHT